MKQIPALYAILPASVRYDENLTDFAKVLFSDIASISSMYGYCSLTNEDFGKLYGQSKRTISNTISRLKIAAI